ncbi:hypothetical protein GCM10028794_01360 [Silanimonas algicola]
MARPNGDNGDTSMIGAGGARQGILSLAIKDKGSLHTAYMSFLRGGGLVRADHQALPDRR